MSLQSHYSIKKASAALGFGTENLILLNTDERLVPRSRRSSDGAARITFRCLPLFPGGG